MLVRYPYVFSAVLASFAVESKPVRIETPGQRYTKAIPYLLFTLAFGWWGVPWGPIYTARAVWTLLLGGTEVAEQV
jgi:hypothetical protein